MDVKFKYTVMTPTYNRAHLLPRLYEALKKQTLKDFEWIIVDDGSTDNTKDVVSSFMKENIININYIFQENGGKQRAYNRGIEAAKGELFTCIDSDDCYLPNGLKEIYKLYKNEEYVNYDGKIYNQKEIAGFSYLASLEDGTIVGTKFKNNQEISTMFEIYQKKRTKGDKGITFKTKVLKNYRFFVFDDEKFMTESYLFNRICREYKMVFVNKKIKIVEYQTDGLSSQYNDLLDKNPKGHALYLNECNYYKMSFFKRINLNKNYFLYAEKAGYNFNKIYSDSENKLFLILSLYKVFLKKIRYKIKKMIKKKG